MVIQIAEEVWCEQFANVLLEKKSDSSGCFIEIIGHICNYSNYTTKNMLLWMKQKAKKLLNVKKLII